MVDHVFIISFNADNVRCAKTLEPRLRCALLSETKKMPKDLSRDEQVAWLVKTAADCKTDFVDLDYKMLTKDMVEKLHQSGLTVWVWTVDEPEAMDDMIAWGIDGITTNCPDVLRSRVDHAGKAN
jgi:glycerophosphoryl diester phosphodiesterase